jgi:Fe-S oxidoreductase
MADVNVDTIRAILDENRYKMKTALAVCAHCSLCAESCFLFANTGDPRYMPSHKFINSTGRLYQKKGRVSTAELEEIREIVWKRCVLCTRCYCPFGIDIPEMIALGRRICRSQGVVHTYDGPEYEYRAEDAR